MKRTIVISAAIMMTFGLNAQSPQKMSYQAVIRDTADNLITNSTIGMQISIIQNSPTGTVVYIETHAPTSNFNGLVSIEIGAGSVVMGDVATIDWSAGPYFIKTENDPNGGTNYTITGTSELLSVPYALYATNSGNAGADNDWTKSGSVVYNNTDNIGIGISNPIEKLEVAGNAAFDGNISLGEASGPDGDTLYFNNKTQSISWYDFYDQFRISDDLSIDQSLWVGNADGTDNDYVYFDEGMQYVRWNETEGQIQLSNHVTVGKNLYVGDAQDFDNDFVFFDAGAEFIGWDEGMSRFVFSDNLQTAGHVSFDATTDADGNVGTGVLEIGQSLRIDDNEIITNMNQTLYLNNDNNGNIRMDNSTLVVDAAANKVGIGTTTPIYTLHVKDDAEIGYIAEFHNTNELGLGISITTGAASNPNAALRYISFKDGSGNENGSIQPNGSGAIVFNATSDRRLKTKIRSYHGALAKIQDIQPREYEFKSNKGTKHIGLIAQELLDLYPQAVSGSPDGDVKTNPMGIDYGQLTPLLIAGMQEQQKIIEYHQKELADIRAELNQIRNAVDLTLKAKK